MGREKSTSLLPLRDICRGAITGSTDPPDGKLRHQFTKIPYIVLVYLCLLKLDTLANTST